MPVAIIPIAKSSSITELGSFIIGNKMMNRETRMNTIGIIRLN